MFIWHEAAQVLFYIQFLFAAMTTKTGSNHTNT